MGHDTTGEIGGGQVLGVSVGRTHLFRGKRNREGEKDNVAVDCRNEGIFALRGKALEDDNKTHSYHNKFKERKHGQPLWCDSEKLRGQSK